jgi:murein DD-endopeptidase MepM/ murein hydrolase activator NlpD
LSPAPADGGHTPVLAPGSHGVVYLEWTVAGRRPHQLAHVLTYAAQSGAPASVRGGRTAVSYDAGAPLGPPLRGGPWIAIHYAGWPKGHRRVFTTVDGRERIPGRFAVDWVRVDDAGRTAQGDPDVAAHALGYGAPVLAVADATVAAVRDDMPEAARVSANPRHALGDEAGNYVALRLGDGRYAFYEHLRPGSVTVRPGQRVRRGEVLGALGFTGSSVGPHLHFHVADGPSPVGAEGRPFTLDGFDLLGRYADPAQIGEAPWPPRPAADARHRSGEWPAENAVVQFPD